MFIDWNSTKLMSRRAPHQEFWPENKSWLTTNRNRVFRISMTSSLFQPIRSKRQIFVLLSMMGTLLTKWSKEGDMEKDMQNNSFIAIFHYKKKSLHPDTFYSLYLRYRGEWGSRRRSGAGRTKPRELERNYAKIAAMKILWSGFSYGSLLPP